MKPKGPERPRQDMSVELQRIYAASAAAYHEKYIAPIERSRDAYIRRMAPLFPYGVKPGANIKFLGEIGL